MSDLVSAEDIGYYDIMVITNLAAGVHIILFTTGHGAPVPTFKIGLNQNIATKKAT